MFKDLKKELQFKNTTYINTKIYPASISTKLTEIMEDGTYKISLKAKPEKNKANAELMKFLAKNLDIPIQNVIIINGKTSKIKLIKISK
ncbi:DUF167 domain-containing protein [Patescibacteria group bacterium]|nr:DUF167 domain-containing protein [Patescibacteria group bacterium]